MGSDSGATPEKGDEHSRPDGSLEVVFAVEDGRVLTFREYPDVDSFRKAMDDAQYAGQNEDVHAMPDIEAFRDLEL